MTRPVFKAKVNGVGKGEISIDGHDISNAVARFEVTSDVNEITTVNLHLIAVQLDLELEGEISIGESAT